MDEPLDEGFLLNKARELTSENRFEEALEILSDNILAAIKNEALWTLKSAILLKLGLPDESLKCSNEALNINPESSEAFYLMGKAYLLLEDFEKSEKNLKRAFVLDSSNFHALWELGNTYRAMKRYDKEADIFREFIEISGTVNYATYRLADALYEDGKYQEAKLEYEKILTSEAIGDYFISSSQSKIQEINKSLRSDSYDEVSKLLNKIKSILLFKDDCITHYTSLLVTKMLILGDGSELRLSEGAYLNDPSEGNELLKLFNFDNQKFRHLNENFDTISKPFVHKPFIGSYVAKIKENDLTLWRMYGKDNKEEAKGCAITMNRERVLHAITRKLVGTSNRTGSENELIDSREMDTTMFDEDINFYRVAYKTHNEIKFLVPGASLEEVAVLNELFKELIEKVNNFFAKDNLNVDQQLEMKELLNDIAYLVKTEEYIFENEVRLVVKGVGFKKDIDLESEPPRVYIKLIKINPLITQITLGPKVDKAEEWSAAFHYHLANEKYFPEIHISHLPFK